MNLNCSALKVLNKSWYSLYIFLPFSINGENVPDMCIKKKWCDYSQAELHSEMRVSLYKDSSLVTGVIREELFVSVGPYLSSRGRMTGDQSQF